MSYQNLTIVGNVGRDGELKHTPQGIAVLKFSVAVNKTTGKGGDKRQTTTWFNVTLWRERAESLSPYVNAGMQVLVTGEVAVSPYIDKNGKPAASLELTALHELAFHLPHGATLFGDKGFISQPDACSLFEATGVRLVTARRSNMTPNTWADDFDLAQYRKRIETLYSQLESMGLQRLHARTNLGFDLKAWATLLALAFSNIPI